MRRRVHTDVELRLFGDDLSVVTAPRPAGCAPDPQAAPGLGLQPDDLDETATIERSAPPDLDVVVRRSKQRKRTVGAQLVGNVLTVTVPAWMSAAEQEHWVEVMRARFARKLWSGRIDLADRALHLARRHDLPRPNEIVWSDNMSTRWGSCTPGSGRIRISTTLARFPDWVIDYVIVHELAHLRHGDHSPEFWALAHRYPKCERAIGYLIAKSGEEHE